MSVMGES